MRQIRCIGGPFLGKFRLPPVFINTLFTLVSVQIVHYLKRLRAGSRRWAPRAEPTDNLSGPLEITSDYRVRIRVHRRNQSSLIRDPY